MRTIATLQEADEGTITLGALDVLAQKHEVRQILGYLPQEFGLYPNFTGLELLDHFAILKGVTHRGERKAVVEALLHKTNLYTHRKKKLKGYSGGMKQRFGIAQALISDPKLIIVDEPTAGLDPAERNRFHNLLCELREDTIVILSTHIVDDVKELCPKMAIMNHGKVLLEGEPMNAMAQMEGKIFKRLVTQEELADYKEHHNVIAERLLQGKPIIHIYSEADPGDGFEVVAVDLHDVYFTEIFGKSNQPQL